MNTLQAIIYWLDEAADGIFLCIKTSLMLLYQLSSY